MKITKRQLQSIILEGKRKILREQDDIQEDNHDHHWPRVDWDNSVGELVDSWADMEVNSFDPGDPSMNPTDGEATVADNKAYWAEQVESAMLDLENEATVAIRQVVLAKMKEISEALMNGDYA